MRTVAITTTDKSAGRVALAVACILLLPLLAMLPIIVGTMMLTRPAATAWFDGRGEQ